MPSHYWTDAVQALMCLILLQHYKLLGGEMLGKLFKLADDTFASTNTKYTVPRGAWTATQIRQLLTNDGIPTWDWQENDRLISFRADPILTSLVKRRLASCGLKPR